MGRYQKSEIFLKVGEIWVGDAICTTLTCIFYNRHYWVPFNKGYVSPEQNQVESYFFYENLP